MKRKIFSALLVLVLLCMPILTFSGCSENTNNDVILEVTAATSLSVDVGTSLTSLEKTQLKINFNYKRQMWDNATASYRYVKEADNDKGYEFNEDGECWFFSEGETGKELSVSEAKAMGVDTTGWNTSKATETDKKRTLVISYAGVKQTVEYTVKAK